MKILSYEIVCLQGFALMLTASKLMPKLLLFVALQDILKPISPLDQSINQVAKKFRGNSSIVHSAEAGIWKLHGSGERDYPDSPIGTKGSSRVSCSGHVKESPVKSYNWLTGLQNTIIASDSQWTCPTNSSSSFELTEQHGTLHFLWPKPGGLFQWPWRQE